MEPEDVDFLRAMHPIVEFLGGTLSVEAGVGDLPIEREGRQIAYVRGSELHGALDRTLEAVERDVGAELSEMSREQKQVAVRTLDEQGVFLLRCAVDRVAKSMGVLVEVTNLLIPNQNTADKDIEALCRWIGENMGRETPLHFSCFHPQHRMRHVPPTPPATLERAREIADAAGLQHVYIGNILVKDAGSTRCPSCGNVVVRRSGYRVLANNLKDGACPGCGEEVYGVWQ